MIQSQLIKEGRLQGRPSFIYLHRVQLETQT